MATPATVNPFNFYPGRDGLPLQNGYLYFGEPFQDPELQPLQAYWDDANTQPAARPIRTINGYPARNGAPAQVFVGAQYSMRVRDSQGREVFYAPNVTAVDLGGGGLDIITASGGQTVVTLTNAIYTPGSNAIDIALNGIIQISGQDYFETGTNRITMASALSAGDQIRAFARSTFGLTQAVLSDWQAEVFDGDGTGSQNFTLLRSPGSVANLDISVAGSTLRPLLDYTLSGNVVTITPAPAAGTDNVLIRYGRSLPQDALRGELADPTSASNGAAMIARGAQVVDSITALKALDKNAASQYAFLTRYASGLEGGGWFRLDASDTTSADNTGTIIVATDGARWKRVPKGYVTLEEFGAYGDGSTSDATPANQACKWCFETGDSLILKGKHYAGARLEVHGSFNIEGNGATVEYLGVGYTLILGTGSGTSAVPTQWGVDPGIYNAAAYVGTLYPITSGGSVGSQTLGVSSAAGLSAGDLVFICDSATTPSSPNNYIPRDFEFARVLTAGTTITFVGRLQNAYTTTGVIVKCPGIAVNCTIDNLRLLSPSDAYQQVVRSAYNVKITNLECAGQPAIGGATFSDLLEYRGIKVAGAYGPISTARGSVSVSITDYEWQPMTGSVGEDCAVFIEESFYSVTLKNCRGRSGYLSVRQANMSGAVAKRHIAVDDSVFETLNASNGATSPMQNGDMTGASMTCTNTIFIGTCVTPNAGTYPGISGAPFAWTSAVDTSDVMKFLGCQFISSNAGAVFTPGSGFLGTVLFDETCTYSTCTPPLTQYTPRGAWSNVSPTSPYTTVSGYALQYRLQNKTVYVTGAMQLNGAASGSAMFTLAAGYRPATLKLISVAAYNSTGVVPSPAFVSIATSGVVTLYYSGTTTYAGVEFSFPTDI